MGSNFDTRVYLDKLGQAKIADQWAIEVESSRFESGVSYSGEIGMLGPNIAKWHDLKFQTETEADNWLSANHDKGDYAVAVSFFNPIKTKEYLDKYDAGKKKLENELNIQIVKFIDIVKNIAEKFTNIKAQYKTCKKCGSKLNHDYLKPVIPNTYLLKFKWNVNDYNGITCPVCRDRMYSETAYERIKKAYIKVEKALKEYDSFDVKMDGQQEKCWLIGGWCSS